MNKKRLLSGVKPTGNPHIGNYFGAMRQFVDLQDEYENFIFIADFHALNQIQDAKKISSNTLEIAKTYLAIGIDPKKTVLFRQSDISPVTELCWILNSITPIGLLQRAHAYKEAKEKGKSINMGLFDYPVLMAADILMYNSDVVPVGEDQKQHLEMTRFMAKSFNSKFGDTFKIPEALINKDVAVIKGLDGRKMSKSYDNVIGLFDSEEATAKKIMSIVTDSRRPNESKDPETCNVFQFHKLFSVKDLKEIKERYKKGGISYKESKEILVKNMNNFLSPIRQRKKELDKNPASVFQALIEGKKKALEVAEEKIKEVKKKVGILTY